MRLSSFLLIAGFFVTICTHSQECLPDGIVFNSQYQIDDFSANYPSCSEIIGDVRINVGINNLAGLAQITSIGGNLTINGESLTNLEGLNNVTSIGGNTKIKTNSLVSLTGLESLEEIGGYLDISKCPSLTNLSGLNLLSSINGYLLIDNNSVNEITGFNNLTYLGGSLRILNNSFLTTINGLTNLSSINGDFIISENPLFKHPNGLGNLETIIGDLEITYNNELLDFVGFNNLTNIMGSLTIARNPKITNFEGLNTLEAVGGSVDIVYNENLLNFMGMDNLYSTGTDQFDRFLILANTNLINFEGLIKINSISDLTIGNDNNSLQSLQGLNTLESISHGYLRIGGRQLKITNFEGLNNLNSIAIAFTVQGNSSLINFNGLENLENIGFGLEVSYNPVLQNFQGLNNLNSIRNLYIDECPQLIDLSGLESLVNMNDSSISIGNCDNFESLNGIQNIDHSTIEYISLEHIPTLYDCSLPNVCAYLYNYGVAYISRNAPGCRNIQDILDHCDPLAITEENLVQKLEIFPNPTDGLFNVNTDENIHEIKIFSSLGNIVKKFSNNKEYSIEDLKSGVYIIAIETQKGLSISKLIKN